MWQAVELRELRVFLAVAEELHFGRAAERLQINRSRVSQMISALEAKVGGRLFERTSRRVRLTPIGEQLVREVGGPYRGLEDALAHARQAAVGVAGTLRLGMYLPTNVGPHMPAIVRAFTERHPVCDVEFVNTGMERSDVDALRGGEVDMLATRLPLEAPGITIGPVLSREPRVLAVAKDDPLADRASISYEDISDRTVTDVQPAFPREMIDAFVPPVTPSGKILKRIANRSLEDVLIRVALGVQVHPTVPSFFDHLSHPGITSVPIVDLPPSETALVWMTASSSRKTEEFASIASEVLSRYRAPRPLTARDQPARQRGAV
jgi:DNA-binding transcriptional LysR family regulator